MTDPLNLPDPEETSVIDARERFDLSDDREPVLPLLYFAECPQTTPM